jgi:hypothetical protein
MSSVWRIASCVLAGSVCASACDDEPLDKAWLSNRGLYSDIRARITVPEALEYEPDYPLWSDGVQKRRWLLLPGGEQIDTSSMAHWQFPVGTKLFKEFSWRGKLLETRLIERISDKTGNVMTDFFLGTFVWQENQVDAKLTRTGVPDALGTSHDVPEQTACVQCHRGEPSAILGVSAVQLSRSGTLTTLAKHDQLTVDPERTFPIPGNEIQVAALGYMNANCGHCHSTEGIADQMRLRFLPEEADRPLEESEVYKTSIGQKITDWKVHPDDLQQRVVPGDPEHSALLYRMRQRGAEKPESDDQMPPIATEEIHHEGIAAVQAWIATLPPLAAEASEGDEGSSAPESSDDSGSPHDSEPSSRPAKRDRGDAGAPGVVQPAAAGAPSAGRGAVNDAGPAAGSGAMIQPEPKVGGAGAAGIGAVAGGAASGIEAAAGSGVGAAGIGAEAGNGVGGAAGSGEAAGVGATDGGAGNPASDPANAGAGATGAGGTSGAAGTTESAGTGGGDCTCDTGSAGVAGSDPGSGGSPEVSGGHDGDAGSGGRRRR